MRVIDYEQLREEVMEVAALTNYNRASLIPVLRTVKDKYRGVDSEAMQIIADVLGCHPVEVNAVATFYTYLNPETEGRFIFRLCRTYSCELAGKEEIARQLARDLGVDFGETSADGAFSLEWANCMGMCDQGPAMLVNEDVFTKLTPNRVHTIVQDYKNRPEASAPESANAAPILGEAAVECGA
jgi:NADH:ubiquinone oxidoreductase subunit E